MTAARDEVLGRVREALGSAPAVPEVPRSYLLAGDHGRGSPELIDHLVDRLLDYKATVVRAQDRGVGATLAEALAQVAAGGPVLHAPGVPGKWLAEVASEADDGARGPRELDRVAAVVTGSVVAIAETGTIVLDGSPMCGRRALTLVPDVHVCVLRTEDVVQTVPEALRLLDPGRPLTFVSGPSATSDIELNRVEGVHGPRTLIVVIA